MIPVGIGTSTNILVGNNIGSNNVEKAKFYAKMCILTAFIWSILSVATMYIFEDEIISMFSASFEVNTIIYDTWAMVSFFVFFDTL